jgi:hypothetical protein
MSATGREEFEALKETLEQIEEVRVPEIPVSVGLAEASALVHYLEANPQHVEALVGVGLEADFVVRLSQAEAALRFAQADWTRVCAQRKPEEQMEEERKGYELRARVVTACRWNLRRDRQAMGALEAIMEGEGVADLMADMDALALLMEAHKEAFAKDVRFEVDAEARALREQAARIREGAGVGATSAEGRVVVLWRNRAWTHLRAVLGEVREAGAYAFKGRGEVLFHFRSSYERRRRSRKPVDEG